MLERLGLNRHVSDADLIAVWTDTRLGESTEVAAGAHVRECTACRARLASLAGWLDGVRIDARQEADEVFSPERLAAQQAQILRRLEATGRPARVLAFPRFTKAISSAHAGRHRWIGAAAVAGLLVGIGLGQTVHFGRTANETAYNSEPPAQISRTVPTPERMAIQPVNLTSDEDFLYDREPATVRVPESLRSLHEITPSAREYDPGNPR
jgi:hypothetical protein